MSTENRDRLFVFLAAALGFLFCEFVFFEGFGIGVPAFLVLFYAAVFWYLNGKEGGFERRGMILLVPIALLGVSFALFDNTVLNVLSFLLLIALMMLQLATMTGNRLYKTFSLGLVLDLFHAGVALPLANIPAPFRALKGSKAEGKRSVLGPVLIGLAISIPLLAIVLSLLSNADIVFEKSLKNVFDFLNDHISEYFFKLFVGLLIAIPLFGLLHALRGNDKIKGLKFKVDFSKVRFMNEGVSNTVLVLLNIVYVLFIWVQFGYLFNAFASILPPGFNYSEYARRGFFELMGVVVVNLIVLGVSYLFSRRNSHAGSGFLKAMETALAALTLLIIASAMSKMVMYMNVCGLTLLRLYTSWFMVLCAVIFIATLVKLYVPKFALTRFCSIAFVALFLALNYANVDALIPAYNIYRYESGISKTIDLETFHGLSDSVVPYAAKLLSDPDKAVADGAKKLLESKADVLNEKRWQVFSAAKQTAKNVLNANKITYNPDSFQRDPDDSNR